MRGISIIAFVGVLSACTSPGTGRLDANHAIGEQRLLSGVDLFGEEIFPDEVPDVELLAVNDEMTAFVDRHVSRSADQGARIRRLIRGMTAEGYLALDYDPHLTLTAAETFRQRRGNCLSFTNLFVALARQARLEVSFQMVDIPPVWLADSDLVILNNHVNVVVDDIRAGQRYKRDYVVDFNTEEFSGNYATRRVSDGNVAGLYYSNVAVEAMRRGDYRLAFGYLAKAISATPTLPDFWVNLGVLYSRNDLHTHAERAYLKALALKPGHRSALSNLASLHGYLGNSELAAQYHRRVRFYQNKNPYYHLWLARKAYEATDYDAAMDEVKRAIKLKSDEHQFYFLQSMIHQRTGDVVAARISLTAARKHALREQVARRYSEKLAALGAN